MKKTNVDIELLNSPGVQNPFFVYLEPLKESSRANITMSMNALARQLGGTDAFSFNWAALRYEHTAMIQTWLLKNKKSATAATIMSAVKGTLKTAKKLHLMDAESYEEAIDLPRIKRGKSLTGRALSPEEIAALLKTCRTGPPLRGSRDAAIIILMAGCGLRENEVTHASLSDYNQTNGHLIVHGKGGDKDGKLRYAYLTGGTRAAMDEWLRRRGNEPGAIFGVISQADEMIIRNMSNMSIYQLLKERGEAAGLQPFTPHDLRRTFISNMLNLTDLATVSRLAGHEDTKTTASYDRRPIEHVIEAAALMNIPFTPRGDDL